MPRFDWKEGLLVVDIETEPNMGLVVRCPKEFSAPSNYKDPDKIRGYIENKRDEWMRTLAVDLDYSRITAVGIAVGNDAPQAFVVGQKKPRGDGVVGEDGLLRWFWKEAEKAHHIIGYNIQGFDLPVIQRRSWVLGIEPTVPLHSLKPWDEKVVDLMKRLYHNGYGPGVKYRGLKWVCEAYGIANALPELDGSQVSEMTPEQLAEYCANDVLMTRELAYKTRGYYW